MTRARRYHIIAISLIVLGIGAGAASWALEGTPFWIAAGVGLALVITGLVFGGRAGAEEEREKQGLG